MQFQPNQCNSLFTFYCNWIIALLKMTIWTSTMSSIRRYHQTNGLMHRQIFFASIHHDPFQQRNLFLLSRTSLIVLLTSKSFIFLSHSSIWVYSSFNESIRLCKNVLQSTRKRLLNLGPQAMKASKRVHQTKEEHQDFIWHGKDYTSLKGWKDPCLL